MKIVTLTRKTTTAAVADHQIFAAATAGVMSTHATAALVNAPLTLVCANVSLNVIRRTLPPMVQEPAVFQAV
jgi:hypothetical protein